MLYEQKGIYDGSNIYLDGATVQNVEIAGRDYETVKIGSLEWMNEDLDYKFYSLTVGNSGTSYSDPMANYYNNSESTYGVNGNRYGLLYNYAAVKYLEDNKDTLIKGWRVPTKADVQDLLNAVCTSSQSGTIYYGSGTALKSTSGWVSGNGDGSTEFNAKPVGRKGGSNFFYVGSDGYFWTLTEVDSTRSYNYRFSTGPDASINPTDKADGNALRLVRDI